MLRGEITLSLEEIDIIKGLTEGRPEIQALPIIEKLEAAQPKNGDTTFQILVDTEEVEKLIDCLQGITIDNPEKSTPELEKLTEKLREYFQAKHAENEPQTV